MTGNTGGSRNGRVGLFCAEARNIGRTTTLVRTALALHEAGRRVLVIDAGPETNRVRAHLGESGPVRSIPVNGVAGLLETLHSADLEHPSLLAQYDHILIDAPWESTEEELAALLGLADTVVICFELNPWPENAAGFIRTLAGKARNSRLVVVGHQLRTGIYQAPSTAREKLHAALSAPEMSVRLRYLEIPYAAEYGGAAPGVVEPARGAAQGVHDAYYEEVALHLGRDDAGPPDEAVICYTPRYVAWASWIGDLLTTRGVETSMVRLEDLSTVFAREPARPGKVLLLVSPCGMTDKEAEPIAALSPGAGVRLIQVDGFPLPETLDRHERIDLSGAGEPAAVDRLLDALHFQEDEGPSTGGARRFPRLPEGNKLAPRNFAFVGRDRVVDELGDALSRAAAEKVACVLQGASGLGKSEIALEYCHRFGGEYEAIWWVNARDEPSIFSGLRELAESLRLTPEEAESGREESIEDAKKVMAKAVLRHLGKSSGWLLVYDGAAEEIGTELLPRASGGRVLVTARTWGENRAEHVIPLERFDLGESAALLTAKLPSLSREQAEQVGSIVGNVPLTVSLAASLLDVWVTELRRDNESEKSAVGSAVRALEDDYKKVQASLASRPGEVTAQRIMFRVVREALPKDKRIGSWVRETGGAAPALDWVLDVCTLLSENGVTLDFLKTEGMQAALMRDVKSVSRGESRKTNGAPGSPPAGSGTGRPAEYGLPTDSLMIDVLVWCLARYGLVEIDHYRPERPLRQHTTVRSLLKADMSQQREDDLKEELAIALAAYRPEGVSGKEIRPKRDEVYRHLHTVELWKSKEPAVRRAVVRRLYELVQTSEGPSLEEALDLGLKAERAWAGDAARERRPEYLRLLNLLAQGFRHLGDYDKARHYGWLALRSQRRHYGGEHPRTLLTLDAYGSILRSLGEFEDAQLECSYALEGLSWILGPDHFLTRTVVHNLALSELLVGNADAALKLTQNLFERGKAIGGEAEKQAWLSVPALASYHRALGQNEQAIQLAKDCLGRHTGNDRLRAEGGLAVSERLRGDVLAAHERDTRLLEECLEHLGQTSLVTLARRVSLTADLYLLEKYPDALDEAEKCVKLLAKTMGDDHPFTQLPRLQNAMVLRAQSRLEEARERGERALELLGARLKKPHPWLAAASLIHANTLVEIGDHDRAVELEHSALGMRDDLHRPGRPEHPDRLIAAENLADTLERQRTQGKNSLLGRRRDPDLELPGI